MIDRLTMEATIMACNDRIRVDQQRSMLCYASKRGIQCRDIQYQQGKERRCVIYIDIPIAVSSARSRIDTIGLGPTQDAINEIPLPILESCPLYRP